MQYLHITIKLKEIMEVKLKEECKGFSPIELSLTIETERELVILCTLFNINSQDIETLLKDRNHYTNEFIDGKEWNELSIDIWRKLDFIYNKHIKKLNNEN